MPNLIAITNNTANVINVTENEDTSVVTLTTTGPQGPPGEVTSIDITSTGGTITVTGSTLNAGNPNGTFNVELPQSVATSASPTFASLTLNDNLSVSGTVVGGTYNGQTITSAASLTGTLAIAGNTTVGGTLGITGAVTGGTYNGQTISSSASLTGTLAVTGAVTGGTYNGQTITSAASLTGSLAVAGNVTGGTYNGQTISSAAAFTGSLSVAGSTSMSGTMTFDGVHSITGLPSPSNSSDVANKAYVDSIAAGLTWKQSVEAATTGSDLGGTYSPSPAFTLTNAGTQVVFAVDGYTASVGNRILVKDQTTQSQNGIYSVTNIGSASTNWVLTRTSDFTEVTPIDEVNGAAVHVEQGTLYGNTSWTQVDKVVTVDSDPISFTQFIGAANGVSSITGTANQITASSATGAVTLSFPSAVTLPGNLTVTPSSGTAVTVNAVGSNTGIQVNTAGAGGAFWVNGPAATELVGLVMAQSGQTEWELYQPASDSTLRFYAAGGVGDAVILHNTGNVTFSAPSSGATLTVNGASGASCLSILSGNTATAENPEIYIQRAGSTANGVAQGPSIQLQDSTNSTGTIIQHSGGQTEIWQDNGSWNRYAYWTASGTLNLSSGTSPGLQITTSSSSPYHILLTRSDLSSTIGVWNNAGTFQFSAPVSTGAGSYYSDNGASRLMLSDNNDGWLRLNNSSNFTNGVYTPGNLRTDGRLYVSSGNYMRTSALTYGTVSVGGGGAGGWYGYAIEDGNQSPAFMASAGQVGCYNMTQSYWMWMDNGTTFSVQKNISCAGTITGSSDINLKKDIVPITGALDKVKQLAGVAFTFIETEERNVGLIAQDVEKVIPEAVKDGAHGHKALAYGNLVGVLVEAIKELEIKIAAIESKVETLQ